MTVHRIPALVLVGVLIAGLVVLERGTSPTRSTIPHRASAADGPTVPSNDAVSVSWFCAEGTSIQEGRADETVLIANLAPHPIEATITVMRGANHSFAVDRRSIDALAQARVVVSDLAEAEEPGVVVEILGGPAIVEHELRGNGDVAVGPCARSASREWFFAAGSTARGAQEWLTLFNPFGQDAIVDVSFLTATRREEPLATQSLAVPRHSRISIPVHEQLLREDRLATEVHANIGRVVAERTLLFDGTDTRKGLAVSLGVNRAAARWRLANGDAHSGTAQSIAIANFSGHSSQVDVSVTLDGESALEPQRVNVSSESVERVELGDRVPVGGSYTIDVRVDNGAPVVVEAFGTWAAPSPVTGIATTTGSVTAARRWALAEGRPDDASDAVISAINVTSRPITVQLYAYTAGDPNSPASAPARAVGPGERAEFKLSEIGIRPDQVIVIAADGLIVVGRLILGGGTSMSPGVPDLN
jgi:hypothetical protein